MDAHIDRRKALLGLSSALLAACGGGGDTAPPPQSSAPPLPPPAAPAPSGPPPSPMSSAVAVKWSTLATDAMLADTRAAPPGLSPMEQSRILAMAFLAGHDALNNIQRLFKPYRVDGSLYSAAQPTFTYEVAVSHVLMALMPAHAAEFQQVLQASLAAGAISPSGDEVGLGMLCAQTLLEDRADDGSANAQGPYAQGTQPGDYQPTPPVNVSTFVNWGKVRPFVMTAGNQFGAGSNYTPAPYNVTSYPYARDLLEVQALGAAVGSLRTPEQSEIAKFWLESTPLSWQRIAAGLVGAKSDAFSLWTGARLFAMLQLAQADAYIACLESKYHFNYWRPITAIRAADGDGNPFTSADPAWEPFDPVTPPVPEYPSAHAAAGAAGAAILEALFPSAGTGALTYLSSTGSTARSFDSSEDFPHSEVYWRIASEIGLSRIYVGYHFRKAVETGWHQGGAVGQWAIVNTLPAV